MSEKRLPYIFILPSVVVLGALVVYPVLLNFWISLHDAKMGAIGKFNNLANYQKVMSDPVFWIAVKNTILWVIGSLTGEVLLGMGVALVLNKNFVGRPFFRGLMLIPWIVPVVVTTFIWKWLLNGVYGIINHILLEWGIISSPILWFASVKTALIAAILVNIWIGTPFLALMILAGLQTIPKEEYEASKMDGASIFQEFWHITLPHLSGILLLVILLRSIWTANNFTTMWLLTGGGPGNSTELLSIQVYIKAFASFNFGQGAAIGVFMFLLLLTLSLFYIKSMEQKRERTGG
jgi:multiple sugar transport system permease protein